MIHAFFVAPRSFTMNRHLLEIENKIESHLRAILDLQTQKLSMIEPENEVPLCFDDVAGMISWNEESINLTPKPYCLIKLLWKSKKRRISITKMEEVIWQVGTEEIPFIERHTILTLVSRAQQKLKKWRFPYKIVSVKVRVKNSLKRELRGYKLVRARRT